MLSNFRQLVQYRPLLWALVVRHLSVRYRGSVLGFLWSFLNPLCLMLVYLLVFRYYIRFNQVSNYTIFLFCGLLPWLWFSTSLLEGTSSIVSSGHLITKSMFPAHILPAVSILTNLVNFLLALPILAALMLATGAPLHRTLLLLPLVIAAQMLLLYGLTLISSALNVLFRDVQHILGNFLTFLFFLCPVLYPVDTVPPQFRFTMDYNPVALLIRFYQQVILNGEIPGVMPVAYFLSVSLLILLAGIALFDRLRESFAEVL